MEGDHLTLDDFTPHIGETFVADFGEDGTLDLVLFEAESLSTGSDDITAFAALFRGPTDRVFQQTMVDLERAGFGRHALFLVAVGESEDGRVYEATFTRMAS